MTEIKMTGLKGLYNRIEVFSYVFSRQAEEAFDVTTFMNQSYVGHELASNSVMLVTRTAKVMKSGQDMTRQEFLTMLSKLGGKISSKEELDKVKEMYTPEFNVGTNKIGEGYRKIGNTVMFTARADFHRKFGHDLILYEYYEILMSNSAISTELNKI
jgi:hypothetical protein